MTVFKTISLNIYGSILQPIFRLRVLANEVEILQGSATLKTKQLKKAELNHAQHWKVLIFIFIIIQIFVRFFIRFRTKNETEKVPSATHYEMKSRKILVSKIK